MSKRYTDTKKWNDDWFGSLSNDYRIIWLWLVDNCSIAGIWKKDFRGLNFNCNVKITEEKFKEVFKGRVFDYDKFFFIPKFIEFQYPNGLNSNKPMIVSVKSELLKYELLDNDTLMIKESLNNDSPIIKVICNSNNNGNKEGVQGEEIEIHPLRKFIKSLDNVSKLSKQLTEDEAVKLEKKLHKDRIMELLGAMENKKDLAKKYTSVYLTILNWSKMRKNEVSNNSVNMTGLTAN